MQKILLLADEEDIDDEIDQYYLIADHYIKNLYYAEALQIYELVKSINRW